MTHNADNAVTDDNALDRLIEGMFPTGEGFATPMKWAEQVKGQMLASDWLAERERAVAEKAWWEGYAARAGEDRHSPGESNPYTPEGDAR